MLRLWTIAGAGFLLSLCTGCLSRGYDLKVSVAPDYAGTLGDEHVFVHLIPMTDANRWRVAAMSVDSYWHYGKATSPTAERERGTQMFELSADQSTALLAHDSPVWDAWWKLGAKELLVLSSRPGPEGASAQGQDPRRLTLPISAGPLSAKAIHLTVTAHGLKQD